MSQQLKFSFNHFKCVSKISVLTKKSNASTSGFEQSSSQKWLEFQTNDYGRRAAIPLETTLHAFRNQEKTKINYNFSKSYASPKGVYLGSRCKELDSPNLGYR